MGSSPSNRRMGSGNVDESTSRANEWINNGLDRLLASDGTIRHSQTTNRQWRPRFDHTCRWGGTRRRRWSRWRALTGRMTDAVAAARKAGSDKGSPRLGGPDRPATCPHMPYMSINSLLI